MNLAEALKETRTSLKGPRCNLCTITAALPKDEASALNEALADSTFSGAGISRALKAVGHSISGGSVQRHRKGECSR